MPARALRIVSFHAKYRESQNACCRVIKMKACLCSNTENSAAYQTGRLSVNLYLITTIRGLF